MTTNPTPNANRTDQEAFVPPYYMLILALLGVLVAVIVAVTQPTFTVVGWGGLGLAVLALLAWVLMAPAQAKAVLTGRTARFGGASVLVTAVFIVALIAIYIFIQGRNIRIDLTERDTFSLNEVTRQAIAGLGADPNVPQVKLLAFYGAVQAGQRDQDTLLFEDYATTSGGKISYEFIDPDRNPAIVEQYKVTRPGQIAVVALKEDGQPDVENAELVNFVSQDQLTNAILRVAAQGDFRAYFLNVDGGLNLTDSGPSGMSLLNNSLTQRYDWKTQQVSLFELTGPQSQIKLDDPAVDGQVIVIPGGDKPLSDGEVQFLADYVNRGGSLVIFAAPGIRAAGGQDGQPASVDSSQPLALAPNLSEFLYTNFGLRFSNAIVLDPTQALQSPLIPVASDFSRTNYITSSFASGRSGLVFELPHPIEIAPELPPNVTVDELVKSTAGAFAKTDLAALLNDANASIEAAEEDPKGPFVLAAAAENSQTGARVVLFGSTSIPVNTLALGSGLVNLEAAFNSLVWSTRFNDFFSTVNVQSLPRLQDAPVFAPEQTLRNIWLVTVVLLPFGILAIGLLVWWNNRERVVTGRS